MKRRDVKPLYPAIGVMAALGGVAGGAEAAPTPAPEAPKAEGGWLAQQVARFRGYPHLDRAYQHLAAGELAEAQAELESTLAVDADNADARLALIDVLARRRNHAAVEREAGQFLAQHGERAAVRMYRGFARQASGRADVALEDFRVASADARASEAERATARTSFTEAAIAAGRLDLAVEALRGTPARQAGFSGAARMAGLLESLGRRAEAAHAWEDAARVATTPREHAQAANARARIARAEKDVDTAQTWHRNALERAGDDLEALRGLADTASERADPAEAEQWARRAFDISRSAPDRSRLAQALASQGRYAQALEHWRALLRGQKDAATRHATLMSMGHAYAAMDEHLRAARSFRKAAALKADLPTLRALQTELEEAGQTRAAIALLKQHPRLLSRYERRVRLGELHARLGEREAALRELRAAARLRPSAALDARISDLYASAGDPAQAARHLEAAVNQRESRAWRRQLGGLYEAAGNVDAALTQYERVLDAGDTPQVRIQLASLYERRGRAQDASAQLEAALAGELSVAERRRAYQQLGVLYGRAGRHREAADSLRAALESGTDDARLHEALAYELFASGLWREAIEQFDAASGGQRQPAHMLAIARCYKALGERDLAVDYLRLAEPGANTLDGANRVALWVELGNLLAARGEGAQAIDYLARAQAADPEPARGIELAALQRRNGKLVAALSTLQTVRTDALDASLQVAHAEELALVYADQQRNAEAAAALARAQAIVPSAERAYRLGHYAYAEGDMPQAITQFERAQTGVADAHRADYAVSLGRAYRAAGRTREAERQFKLASDTTPPRGEWLKELAYTQLALGEHDSAAQSFKRAIDLAQAAPASDAREVDGMRDEVARLSRRWEVSAYQTMRSNARVSSAQAASGALPAQGGLEAHYLVPQWRSADGRGVDVFARTTWGTRERSLAMDTDTLQGSVGVRAKPFAKRDLYLSAERLIKVGSKSESDWLLRASTTLGDGYALRRGERSWNYTQLYADAGYFTRHGGVWAGFGELRQGWSFNFGDRLIVTPHATLSGRTQSPDPDRSAYAEWGGGVSLRALFNENRYETPRSSAELLFQYKRGIAPDARGAWVVTAAVNF